MKTSSSTSLAIKNLDAKRKAPTIKTAKATVAKKTAKKAVVSRTHVHTADSHTHAPVKAKKTAQKTTPGFFAAQKGPMPTIKRNPLGHLLIEKILREAGFRGGISSDKRVLEKYSTDESIFSIQPQVVIQPKNRQDVEIATKVIARETKRFSSLSLTPRAAGTGLSGGSLTDSIVVDVCAHLNKIGEVVEKRDTVTFTCEPGAMWRDVEKKLKRHGAYLPPYTSSKDICSIGGSIGNNAAGPDSLRYGHCADWVDSLDVVLCDGHTYTIKPLTYREFKSLVKEKHEHARIAREVFALVEKNEKEIKNAKPKTQKNTAGYSLWHVVPEGVEAFKKGKGTFDLTRLISGSQGTIGIITNIAMRALPIQQDTTLLVVPIFDLQEAAKVVMEALKYNPINIELFDGLSFDLALKNPDFFKKRLSGMDYYRTMLNMYSTFHIRYGRKTPEFTILITLDKETTDKTPKADIIKAISTQKARARVVTSKIEAEMLWQIRRASYILSKFQDANKRPAAFLEDMTVPPENLAKFFIEIKKLLKEFNVTAAVHGHGGNGHFHFYPLLDFTNKTTPMLIEKMAEKFYSTAIKFKGNICGEHNDGIIRTPHLNKLFSKRMLEIFKEAEAIFDPDDIFNPGKKVNPRFDIKESMRTTN
jgi:FAD/FMN-containing dehydrogenase